MIIFDLKCGFLVNNCIHSHLDMSRIPKIDQNMASEQKGKKKSATGMRSNPQIHLDSCYFRKVNSFGVSKLMRFLGVLPIFPTLKVPEGYLEGNKKKHYSKISLVRTLQDFSCPKVTKNRGEFTDSTIWELIISTAVLITSGTPSSECDDLHPALEPLQM